MRKKRLITVITMFAAVFIIAAGFFSIQIYSGYRKDSSVNHVKSVKLKMNSEYSLELSLMSNLWENSADIQKLGRTVLPDKQMKMLNAIERFWGWSETIFDYAYVDETDAYQVFYSDWRNIRKYYINRNQKGMEFLITLQEEKGEEYQEKSEKLLEQLENGTGEISKRTDETFLFLAKLLYKNSIIPEIYSDEENLFLLGKAVFIHDKKIYIVYYEDLQNYFALMYDYKEDKFCGCKVRFPQYMES